MTVHGNPDDIAATLQLYGDLLAHCEQQPDDLVGISQRFAAVLAQSMDAYEYDIESVTAELSTEIFRRTRIVPGNTNTYNRPLTREDVESVTAGAIPLLVARAVLCILFHAVLVHIRASDEGKAAWTRFCHHYAERLPRI